jgi:hypothetical protein
MVKEKVLKKQQEGKLKKLEDKHEKISCAGFQKPVPRRSGRILNTMFVPNG